MNWALVVDQGVAAAAWAGFTEWEIRQNTGQMAANGSQDTLKAGFHQRRGWIRFWWGLGLTVAGSLWATGAADFALAFAGLGLGAVGYFVRTFNPRLSFARNLPYVPRFYVSFAPGAAGWPDAWLARQAVKRYPSDETRQRAWAQQRLQLVLNLALFAGLAAWAGLGYLAVR